MILTILANRGITGQKEIERFLNPTLEQLPQPRLLSGMERAVAILVEARAKGIPVLIHGDYDADGVSATALLVRFFREIGLSVYHFIPDRLSEGYGLSLDSLPLLRNRPVIANHAAPILVTVDCGITSVAEISLANSLGFRVIVTDHHQPGSELPPAEAIINPHQPGCDFPFRDLAGVGVAFYLAAGVRAELVRQEVWPRQAAPNLKKYLDLVAIGSVADMVPLRGVNRILVKAGLEMINRNPGLGIKALLAQIGQGSGKVSAETIAYQLAPRLNAAGRTGSAEQALDLLLADDEISAKKLAESLSQANQLRKGVSEAIYREAMVQAEKQLKEGRSVLVVAAHGWHQGVAGLVASKLAREFWRPAVVLALDDEGLARGSARSVGDLDILACLMHCTELLEKCGGHRAAAGISLKATNVAEFSKRLDDSVTGAVNPADLEPRLAIDLAADPGEIIQEGVLHYLRLLEPHGNGNPEPVFCSPARGVRLSALKKVGADSLRFRVKANGKDISGVGFGLSAWAAAAARAPLRLAYKIMLNSYRGAENWEMRVEDVKKAD